MRAIVITVPVALCATLAALCLAQSAPQQTTAKSTTGARKSTKSTAAAKPILSTPVAKGTTPKSAPVQSNAAKSSTGKSNTAKLNTATSTAAKPVLSATGKRPAAAGKSTKPPVSSYRAPQQQPTPDRYKEIQQALADRGYFAGPVDGNWGPTSTDALKRFQHDQNLLEDGKVGSLSLIALGLGPKRGAGSTNQPLKSSPSDPQIPVEPTEDVPQ